MLAQWIDVAWPAGDERDSAARRGSAVNSPAHTRRLIEIDARVGLVLRRITVGVGRQQRPIWQRGRPVPRILVEERAADLVGHPSIDASMHGAEFARSDGANADMCFGAQTLAWTLRD